MIRKKFLLLKFKSLFINSTISTWKSINRKISQLVRRLSLQNNKSKDIFNYNPLIKDFYLPKISKKSLLKSSSKLNCDSKKRLLSHDKSFILNKTTVCTLMIDQQCSVILLHPMKKSFNLAKMKAFKSVKKEIPP